MIRLVLGIIAGVLIGFVVVSLVEMAGHMIFPPPADIDMNDPVAMKAMIGRLPVGAIADVLAAWALGILAGGFAAAKIARLGEWPAWVVAACLFAAAVYTMIIIPHPTWFMASSVAVTLGMGWLAGRLGASRGAAPEIARR